ncbi:MAG: hypothetical protein B7X78_05405, partial [Sphingomonadales bacterium 39-62-4]
MAKRNIRTWMGRLGYPTETAIIAAGFPLKDAMDGPQGWPFESSLCLRVIDAINEGRFDRASVMDMVLLTACSSRGDLGGEMKPSRTRSIGNIKRLQAAVS